ncbi:ABC transporter permease [Deinococcus aquiradiocola]|uniref:Autoinducer 2 import system permease protein LsrC n=1 Tax=Deinococcus aquiradiocola TaxID=393059 RepID=A0A917PH47_9DEIO|nr:ABC transporter permease [Deinococcus aquiradiocola]GGJ76956.1 ABC transporter permease [Deinococcus aquiradiocola]
MKAHPLPLAGPPLARPLPGPDWRRILTSRELILIAATLLVTLLAGLVNHDFLAGSNLRFMLLNSVVLGLVALGQTLVIITRGIDLSVAPVLGLAAVVSGLLATRQGLPLWGAVLLVLLLGAVLGLVNGTLVSRVSIPPIIVTLGTYSLYGGLIFLYSGGDQVNSVPDSYAHFGNGVLASWFPVPIPILVLLLVTLAVWFLLGHLPFGRNILAIGNNPVAAHHAGVPVRATLTSAYLIAGTLAALAGLIYVCYTGSATATTGTGDHFELQSIATVLIGGTAVSGGRGSVPGTVLGSTFLSVILTALVFLHVPAIWYSAGEGVMILLAVTSSALNRTGRGRAA